MPLAINTIKYYMLQKTASGVYRVYVRLNNTSVNLPDLTRRLKRLHYDVTLIETERYWATNGDSTHDKDCVANYRFNEQFIRSKK